LFPWLRRSAQPFELDPEHELFKALAKRGLVPSEVVRLWYFDELSASDLLLSLLRN
jgi:hypothetical protein